MVPRRPGEGRTVAGIILLGALAVPFLLIAAAVRGGWRAHRERAAAKQRIKDFE
jgi:hypothetical protein